MGRKPTATPLEVAAFADAMITQSELAEILGITPQSVSEMLHKPAYKDAWERARASTRYKLRRAQIEAALKGDRTMLIWTGKQYLEQRDSPKEVEINQNVQVRYIAEWGGAAPEELPAGEEMELIEGEVEED
jgi:predicted transcriptional regulator